MHKLFALLLIMLLTIGAQLSDDVYTLEEEGYSIGIPQGWQIFPEQDAGLWVWEGDNLRMRFKVYVMNLPNHTPISEDTLGSFEASFVGEKTESKVIDLPAGTAIRWRGVSTDSIDTLQYFIRDDNAGYLVVFSGVPGSYTDVAAKIMDTFTLKNPPENLSTPTSDFPIFVALVAAMVGILLLLLGALIRRRSNTRAGQTRRSASL